jgi:dTMP kinase
MFITLCGIDGAGKTTLGAMLAAELERVWPTPDGRPARVVFRKLVGDNSEVVRYYKILVEVDPLFDGRAQNYIFAFERVRTANTTLRELQQQYDIVIIDRYVYCDIAYSRARGRDDSMYYTVLEHVPIPDVGFIIDVPADVALGRVSARKEVWTFQENGELLRRARETYLGVAEEFGQIVIDGSGDPAHSVEKMVDIVMRARAGAGRQLLGSGIRA